MLLTKFLDRNLKNYQKKVDQSFAQKSTYIHYSKVALKLGDKLSFTHRNVANFFFVYELDMLLCDFTLKSSLFEAASLTQKANPNKCSYSGYDIRLNLRSLSQFTVNIKL